MTLTVELCGLEVFAHHGVEDEERRTGQRFLVDVWLDVPDTPARSDRIEDAVDYRAVAETVREVAEGRQFRLLEAVAAALADLLVERFPAERARVRVRKPDVRLALPVEYSAVSAQRRAPSSA
jgi:dihydroneopterin aldolase